MRELRTQENNKFEHFFQLVRNEANKIDSIFFVDCGEGNEFIDNDMEGENLSGWLIPKKMADDFQKEFDKNEASEKWDDFMSFARWDKQKGEVRVTLEEF